MNAPNDLGFRLTGPGGFTAFDGVQSSPQVVTLPTSGRYVLAIYGINGQTGSYAFAIDQATQSPLVLGTPYHGTLVGSGQAQLFTVTVPVGEFLHVTLSDSTAADSNELYLRYDLPPTRAEFDYSYSAVGSANQDVWALRSTAGTWYVLVYGASVPSASSFTLLATASPVAVSSYTPQQQGNNTDAVVTLSGAGFTAATTVALSSSGGTSYPAATVYVNSPTNLTATFPAGTVPAGVYAIKVSQGAAAPLCCRARSPCSKAARPTW